MRPSMLIVAAIAVLVVAGLAGVGHVVFGHLYEGLDGIE
jgi:hypothetical protein